MLRRRNFMAVFVAVLLAAGAAQPAAAEAPRNEYRTADRGRRALWVWRSTFLEDVREQKDMLQFARKRGIRTLFLFTSTRRLRKDPELFRRFLAEAHSRKIAVQALNGMPQWVFRHQREGVAAYLDEVLRFNQESPRHARFDGIHLDVEPQALPEWKSEDDPEVRQKLADRYVELLRWSQRRIRDAGIPLSVDVPLSFNSIQVKSKPMLVAILERVDEVALMAYLDKGPDILSSSQSALAYAERMGKRVWVGISADPDDLPKPVGRTRPDQQLEAMTRTLEKALQTQPSFQGVAFHEYDHYRLAHCRSKPGCLPEPTASGSK